MSEKGKEQSVGQTDIAGEIVARIPREGLRSMFHLMVGKPDSTQQSFPRPIVVSPSSISDLNDRITEKLKNHHVVGMVVSVDVANSKNKVHQFGSWPEFLSHKWNMADETKEVVAKWDFVVFVPGFEFPQRHSVVVRVTDELKPVHLLRQVFSEDRDDDETIELKFYPIVCRVDFINHVLSKELLNIVSEWNQALAPPECEEGFLRRLQGKENIIKSVIRYSVPILVLAIAFALLRHLASPHDPKSVITVGFLSKLMYWLLASISSLYASLEVARWLGWRAENAITRYGRFSVFRFTSGDQIREKNLQKRNRRRIREFLFSSGVALLLNVLAGFIVYWLI